MTGSTNLTKLTWENKIENATKNKAYVVEVNNSLLASTEQAELEKLGLAYGRKPYLISKEYVAQGEPYDYLAMMETEFTYGQNNDWVVSRKPYKDRDYHLSGVSGGGTISTYLATEIYSSDSLKVRVTDLVNLGKTTLALVTVVDGGTYTLYAKDSIGNIISFEIEVPLAELGWTIYEYYNNRSNWVVYKLKDLLDGNRIPYTSFPQNLTSYLKGNYISYILSTTSAWLTSFEHQTTKVYTLQNKSTASNLMSFSQLINGCYASTYKIETQVTSGYRVYYGWDKINYYAIEHIPAFGYGDLTISWASHEVYYVYPSTALNLNMTWEGGASYRTFDRAVNLLFSNWNSGIFHDLVRYVDADSYVIQDRRPGLLGEGYSSFFFHGKYSASAFSIMEQALGTNDPIGVMFAYV